MPRMRWRSRTKRPSWVVRAPRTCSPRPTGAAAVRAACASTDLNLETTVRELYGLLWELAGRSDDGTIPLDGIVFPKIEHPEEVDLVHGMLTEAERSLGLPVGGIRV